MSDYVIAANVNALLVIQGDGYFGLRIFQLIYKIRKIYQFRILITNYNNYIKLEISVYM